MFLAVDWGTTNRRCYLIDGGGVLRDEFVDDHGAALIARPDFPGAMAAVRARLGDHSAICAGMVGSTLGWIDAGYVACPADLGALSARLVAIDARTLIVPGVRTRASARPDVMRGEEVQIVGALALGAADGLYCQPGTHSKWIEVAGDRIVTFRTAMTGELFDLLRAHSVLRDYLGAPVRDGEAFRAGVRLAREGRLLTDLFGRRAAVVLGNMEPDDVAARVSGLLIGTDIREQALARGATVRVVADPLLGSLYAAALGETGVASQSLDSRSAFVAGAYAIWKTINADR